jgi:hypothetical protein
MYTYATCHLGSCSQMALTATKNLYFNSNPDDYIKRTSTGGIKFILKVHKNENFFGFDFEIRIVLLLVMLKYEGFVKKLF